MALCLYCHEYVEERVEDEVAADDGSLLGYAHEQCYREHWDRMLGPAYGQCVRERTRLALENMHLKKLLRAILPLGDRDDVRDEWGKEFEALRKAVKQDA